MSQTIKDKNGAALQVGDKITLEAVIRDITTVNATNLTAETVEPVYGTQKTTLFLASSQVALANPPESMPAAPSPAEKPAAPPAEKPAAPAPANPS